MNRKAIRIARAFNRTRHPRSRAIRFNTQRNQSPAIHHPLIRISTAHW